jgi:hypothetical protein
MSAIVSTLIRLHLISSPVAFCALRPPILQLDLRAHGEGPLGVFGDETPVQVIDWG